MNSLQLDVTDKVVIIKRELFPRLNTIQRVFLVQGGFGRMPQLIGSAVFGTFLYSGRYERIDGLDLERLASVEEIKAATELKAKAG